MAVFDATLAELTSRGAVESFEGQLALRLAEQVDAPRAGMAVAQDARELRAVMAVIREQNVAEVDPIDELDARRKNRGSAAEAV